MALRPDKRIWATAHRCRNSPRNSSMAHRQATGCQQVNKEGILLLRVEAREGMEVKQEGMAKGDMEAEEVEDIGDQCGTGQSPQVLHLAELIMLDDASACCAG